jgi:hypothetical protein
MSSVPNKLNALVIFGSCEKPQNHDSINGSWSSMQQKFDVIIMVMLKLKKKKKISTS